MPGKKGRSGAPGRKAYPGAGRPPTDKPLQLLRLSQGHADKLATITRWRRNFTGNMLLSQRQIVEGWIDEHWAEVDEAVLLASEQYAEAQRDGMIP